MAKNKTYRYLVFLKDKGAVPVEGVSSVTHTAYSLELTGEGYSAIASFNNDSVSGWVRQSEVLEASSEPPNDLL